MHAVSKDYHRIALFVVQYLKLSTFLHGAMHCASSESRRISLFDYVKLVQITP